MMGLRQSLRQHWPEYLMEAWGLGAFMVAAGIAVVLMESPDAYLHGLIADADLRRARKTGGKGIQCEPTGL